MKNKLIGIAVVVIITLVTTALILRLFFGSENSLTFRMFNAQDDGYYLHKFLHIVPASYQDRYTMTVLDSFDNKKIICLVDALQSSHNTCIVYIDGACSRFLKAYPLELTGNKMEIADEVQLKKYVSLQINVSVFNEYVQLKQLSSKSKIIELYCYFLSIPSDRNSYQILNNTSDIDSLLANRPVMNLEFAKATGNLIDAKSLDFGHSDEVIFCWFYDTGVVKFVFEFDVDRIKSVDSEIIGLLGIEAPTI